MALVGTTVENKRTPELLVVTWTVASGAAALDVSEEISLKGYSAASWHITATTGYVSGDLKIGIVVELDGDGLVPEDVGRHKRALKSSTTLNEAGYVLYPPPIVRLTVGNHDGASTAYTVKLHATASQQLRSGFRH